MKQEYRGPTASDPPANFYAVNDYMVLSRNKRSCRAQGHLFLASLGSSNLNSEFVNRQTYGSFQQILNVSRENFEHGLIEV